MPIRILFRVDSDTSLEVEDSIGELVEGSKDELDVEAAVVKLVDGFINGVDDEDDSVVKPVDDSRWC